MPLEYTSFSDELKNYTQTVVNLGFEKIGEFGFATAELLEHNESKESINVYAHKDGFILIYDTWQHSNALYLNRSELGMSAIAEKIECKSKLHEINCNSVWTYEEGKNTGKELTSRMIAGKNIADRINIIRDSAELTVPFSWTEKESLSFFQCRSDFYFLSKHAAETIESEKTPIQQLVEDASKEGIGIFLDAQSMATSNQRNEIEKIARQRIMAMPGWVKQMLNYNG